jgi:DNA-binding NarL/FixJ family response regulator
MARTHSGNITVIVADDHAWFRGIVLELLAGERDLTALATAPDGIQALAAILEHRPRVAVLDMEMPGLGGLEIARAVADRGLPTAVVILTFHKEEHIVRRAIDLGVAAYVLKEHADSHLIAAIRAAAGRRAFFSPGLLVPAPLHGRVASA